MIPNGLVHEHAVVVGVQPEQQERQQQLAVIRSAPLSAATVHQERPAFGPASDGIGQHQGLHNAAACDRPAKRLDKSRRWIERGQAHENGSIESLHGYLKRAIEDALVLWPV